MTKKPGKSNIRRGPSLIIGIILIVLTVGIGIIVKKYDDKKGKNNASGQYENATEKDDKGNTGEKMDEDPDDSKGDSKNAYEGLDDDYLRRAAIVYKSLRKHGITRNGAISIMCAAGGESGMRADNLEDTMESFLEDSKLIKGVQDDETFTKAVNSGYHKGSKPRISRDQFVQAGILDGRGKVDVWCELKNDATGSEMSTWGYGLIQFSSSNRKDLYDFAEDYFKENKKKFDIGDLEMQAAFIAERYSGFATVKSDINDKRSRYVIEILKDESVTDFDFLMASVMRCLVAPYSKSYPNAYAFLGTKSGKKHISSHTDKMVGNTGKTIYEINCYVADYVDGN